MYRVIERPSGTGSVTDENGAELGPCEYSLVVQEENVDVGGVGPGPPVIEGRVVPQGWGTGDPTDALVLHLADGRRLPFFFTEGNEIAARGQLK